MATKAKKRKVPNKKFPGRPDYIGPTRGYFAFVHHGTLYERSHNIKERVEYVRSHKPDDEIAIRLNHLLYLGGALGERLAAGHGSHKQVLAYVKRCIPRVKWSTKYHSLMKAPGVAMTG